MKLIYVHSGDDFAANEFENKYGGTPVAEIIANPEKFSMEDEGIELEIKEVGEVSPEFVAFIRQDIQDYDHSKNTNFWMEFENVGG